MAAFAAIAADLAPAVTRPRPHDAKAAVVFQSLDLLLIDAHDLRQFGDIGGELGMVPQEVAHFNEKTVQLLAAFAADRASPLMGIDSVADPAVAKLHIHLFFTSATVQTTKAATVPPSFSRALAARERVVPVVETSSTMTVRFSLMGGPLQEKASRGSCCLSVALRPVWFGQEADQERPSKTGSAQILLSPLAMRRA